MKLIKRMSATLHTRIGAYVFYALAASAITLLHSAEWAYSWIARSYPLGENFFFMFFCILGVCAAVTLGFFLAPATVRSSRATRLIHTAFAVLTTALFIFIVVLHFSLDHGFDPSYLKNGLTYLAPNLPLLSVAIALPFLFVLYPHYKKRLRAVLAVIISIAVTVPLLAVSVLPEIKPFAISANPLVLDIGDGFQDRSVMTTSVSLHLKYVDIQGFFAS